MNGESGSSQAEEMRCMGEPQGTKEPQRSDRGCACRPLLLLSCLDKLLRRLRPFMEGIDADLRELDDRIVGM